MEIEKGKTAKYLKEKRTVSPKVIENLKNFTKIKKRILDALKDGEQTIEQLTAKTEMPKHEVLYYLMSLIKYGYVQTGDIDEMDEFFFYKLKI
jgi:hypothetical protein